MKKTITGVVVILVIVAIIIAFSESQSNSKLIKIGVITALSGSGGVATYGVPLKNGIDLALKEIDPEHKIYDIRYEDYQLDTKQALPAYAKLKSEGVKIFIIDGSPALSVLTPEIRKDGFLEFNTSSFIPSYKDENPMTCRMALTSDNYGPAYANLLTKTLHINKVVALLPNYEAGVSLLDSLKKSYNANGGEILDAEMYPKDTTDFRTYIEKLKTYKDAQAIFVTNYFNSANTMLDQMKTLGLNLPIITDDWTATLPQDKSLLNGAYFVGYSFSLTDPNDARGKAFFDLYKNTYSTRPLINAAQSYDMMHIINNSIKNSGFNLKGMAQYITTKMPPYQGVGGTISFNADCEVQREVNVGHVQNGKIISR